jgi:hypothetical protein
MKLTKNHKVSIAFWVSLLGGIFVLTLTQPPNLKAGEERKIKQAVVQPVNLISAEDYIEQIRPWLKAVVNNYSPATIGAVKNKLLTLQSSEPSLGQAHINLFLAFQNWEDFLNSEQGVFKEQTKSKLTLVVDFLPALSPEINDLQNILN